MSAHEAAVAAMAAGIFAGMRGRKLPVRTEAGEVDRDVARLALAALVADPDVREALAAALDDAPYHPGAAADAILAALMPAHTDGDAQ